MDELLRRVPPASEERRWDPGSQKWITHPDYAKLAAAANPEQFTDDQWRFVLANTGIIQTRPRWPESVPLTVRLIAPYWLAPWSIRATPRIADAQPIRAANFNGCTLVCYTGGSRADARDVVGRVNSGMRSIEFACEVTVHEVDGASLGGPRVIWEGDVSVPIEIVPSAAQAMEAVTDEGLPRPMREIVRIVGGRKSEGLETGGLVHVWAFFPRAEHPLLRDVALGLTADVLRNGDVVGTGQMPPRPWFVGRSVLCGTASSTVIVLGKEVDAKSPADWALRVRGDAEMALADLDASKYWAGEFTRGFDELYTSISAAMSQPFVPQP